MTPSWWERRVVPRLVDVALNNRATGGWRTKVCGGVTGEILEVGFGSGKNLAHYGPEVTRVHAVEPSDVSWARANAEIEIGRSVVRIGLDGASLALPDHSVDAVVSTWTMCTIADLESALSEMKRVLSPGGALHFVEHSAAPSSRVARAQNAIQPLWGPVAGGCHINRDIPGAITAAGFELLDFRERYATKVSPARPFSWFVTGVAVPART